ncbi:YihY/virulence factor BrkB family protein [Flavobacterium restrictum]|uniref:YihY/virulence factor BrkB family protein n=1 Tax=Flavobacterium restrictum TaxID=2594428 RepID=A0A553EDE2_9FLAO|nr:YihY/virulence factor BrkB family protein [Flavobacterium restrictum]TRX43015.1 YihY/virulence factor BrkB family protein [Flavobacterium restrictum]
MTPKKIEPLEIRIKKRVRSNTFVTQIILFLDAIKLSWLEGLSLYGLLRLYGDGIATAGLSIRAGAIAFSFFMALFPFALFILNLIPFIPIEGFQQDFLDFVAQSVPPNTYDAIAVIINDILNNSHSGLLSSGFLLSIFIMANGLNAILGAFENSPSDILKRGFFKQYLVALAISLLLSFLLLFTVATIVVFEVFIQQSRIQDVVSNAIPLIQLGRFGFFILMILITTSILFRYGTMQAHKPAFITIGSVFTTILIIISSYFFGIWVVKFSKYNQLYGSIGTLLVMMFYIWINCMILLLGFELNATINKHKIIVNNLKIK